MFLSEVATIFPRSRNPALRPTPYRVSRTEASEALHEEHASPPTEAERHEQERETVDPKVTAENTISKNHHFRQEVQRVAWLSSWIFSRIYGMQVMIMVYQKLYFRNMWEQRVSIILKNAAYDMSRIMMSLGDFV